jgi:predicted metal-dependent HD superfamily phosphohydrolase
VQQPEPLDHGRWRRLWQRLGARGDGAGTFSTLAAAYAEPARAYHTTEHILDCLAQFDLAEGEAERPTEVEAALWFHDAVYLPDRTDNEERSADLARGSLSQAGAPLEATSRVAELVLATRHVLAPTEADARLVCDIDLSILGRSPDVFDEFERRIRKEYAWVPDPLFRTRRAAILESFLRRDSVYQTDFFRERYETGARSNLARAIKSLMI